MNHLTDTRIVGCLLVAFLFGIGLAMLDSRTMPVRPEDPKLLYSYYKELSLKKGIQTAYMYLAQEQQSQGKDIHQLGHAIATTVYQLNGPQGIRFCTGAFQESCSHEVVLRSIAQYGETIVPDMVESCRRHMTSYAAVMSCIHGLGHGAAVYTGYDMDHAVRMCQFETHGQQKEEEYIACLGGLIMEMYSGSHDRITWAKVTGKYFTRENPLILCDALDVSPELRNRCFFFFTPILLRIAAGGDEPDMAVETVMTAFSYCNRIVPLSSEDRKGCFGGFGREFLLHDVTTEIQEITDVTDEKLHQAGRLCAMAPVLQDRQSCVHEAMVTLYKGGVNPVSYLERFCTAIPGEPLYQYCTENIRAVRGLYVQ
jgi:hypothetical protein